LLLAQFSVRS